MGGRLVGSTVVLQDTVVDTNTVYLARYDSLCLSERKDTANYYKESGCFILKRFQTYEELKEKSDLNDWSNITFMHVGCVLSSVRIINGFLYCREDNKYNKDTYYDRLVKADLQTGAVIYDRMLRYAKRSSDSNDCCKTHWLLIDETGMWLLNKYNYGNAVLELLDPHDLSTVYEKTMPFQLSYADYNDVLYFMLCGKLYIASLDNIQAWDISNMANTFNYKAKVAPNLAGRNFWPHYNPRLKQFFVATSDKNYRFKVSTCSSRFPLSLNLSIINSTFLWSITPTSLNDTGHYTKLVEELERYTNNANVDVQIAASNLITTCHAEFCRIAENSTSLFCRIKSCASSLRVMADFKKTLTAKRKILETEFHMQQILQQTTLRTIALKIADLRLFTQMEFDQLKTVITQFKNDLGNYFNELAKYDGKKAQADVDFIYSRLDSYNKTLAENAKTLQPKLQAMFYGAIGTVSAEMVALTAKLAMAMYDALVPVPPGAGASDVMDAIDELAVKAVDIVHLEFLSKVLPDINRTCYEMNAAIQKTAVVHVSVKKMIYAAKNKNLTSSELEQYHTAFLKEYNDYNPGLNSTLIAQFGETLDQSIDKLCELIFSGEHLISAVGMYVFANRGDCFYTKVDAAKMIAIYEKYNEFQYDLMEAMASFVRAKIAETTSKVLVDVRTELDKAEQERDLLKMRVHAMEIYIQSEMHLLMVIHDACSLIEYKSGGVMPDYCNQLIQNPHSTEYDKLVAYPYGTDMCSVDQIVKYVRIPAAYPTANNSVPKGTIDLASLYSGNITSFQIPDQQWLVRNHWVSQHDSTNKWFIKRLELFLPYGSTSSLRVHVTKTMAGNNVITPGGTVYDFTTRVQFDLRYEENAASCYNTLVAHPYQTPGCPTKPQICVQSRGWMQSSPFHASAYSRWDLQLRVDAGTLKPVKAVGDFYLKAGIILCKVGAAASRGVDDQVEDLKPVARSVCCANSNQFYDPVLGNCNNCTTGGCVKLSGYFCGNCTYPWP